MQGVFEFCRETRARPARPERLFFGLLPDRGTAGRIARFRDRFVRDRRLEGTRIKTECLHVSLHHVGDFRGLRGRFIYAAQQAGNAVALPPFEVTFRFIRSFDAPRSTDGRTRAPLVLLGEGAALVSLHKGLGAAMKQNGLRPSAHFAPHMTLFYGAEPVPIEAIEPIRAVVDCFTLIHSELGHARHNIVDRWPLQDRPCDGLGSDTPVIAGANGTDPHAAGW